MGAKTFPGCVKMETKTQYIKDRRSIVRSKLKTEPEDPGTLAPRNPADEAFILGKRTSPEYFSRRRVYSQGWCQIVMPGLWVEVVWLTFCAH